MKVVIAGSRIISDYNLVEIAVIHSGFKISEVVSGTARGADRLGEQYALRHSLPIRRFPADWSKGRSAGMQRNRQMAEYADAVIVLWDGKSPGSANMIRTAMALNKPVYVLRTNGGNRYQESLP